MQEDLVGTTPTIRPEYATCPECGQVFRRSTGEVDRTGIEDDVHSEYQELCPECARLDQQGELPLNAGDRDSRP
jgi:hypothetical protein